MRRTCPRPSTNTLEHMMHTHACMPSPEDMDVTPRALQPPTYPHSCTHDAHPRMPHMFYGTRHLPVKNVATSTNLHTLSPKDTGITPRALQLPSHPSPSSRALCALSAPKFRLGTRGMLCVPEPILPCSSRPPSSLFLLALNAGPKFRLGT